MKNFEMPRYMVTKGSWNYILSILKRNNAGSYAKLSVPDNKQTSKGNIKGSKNKLSADTKPISKKKK